MWSWQSISPGSTVIPEASMTSSFAPGVEPPVVMASTRPSRRTRLTSRTGAAPVPSMRVPARTIVMTDRSARAVSTQPPRNGQPAHSGRAGLDDAFVHVRRARVGGGVPLALRIALLDHDPGRLAGVDRRTVAGAIRAVGQIDTNLAAGRQEAGEPGT